MRLPRLGPRTPGAARHLGAGVEPWLPDPTGDGPLEAPELEEDGLPLGQPGVELPNEPPDVEVAAFAPPVVDVANELRLAHLHLRMGAYPSARALLETLVGMGDLGTDGLADLAESRWRTGDLDGAGEAAAAHLARGGEATIALLVGAEAHAVNGRPTEARELARRVLASLELPLDAVFAGQPRSSIWPHDPGDPGEPAGTLFDSSRASALRGGRIGLSGTVPSEIGRDADARQWGSRPERGSAGAAYAARPGREGGSGPQPDAGFWDDEPRDERGSAGRRSDPGDAGGADRVARPGGRPDGVLPDAQEELDRARAALRLRDQRGAALHLLLVLRLSPALAPVVLDLVGQLPGPEFDIIRGDALRLAGHEAGAQRAFSSASASIVADRDRPIDRHASGEIDAR